MLLPCFPDLIPVEGGRDDLGRSCLSVWQPAREPESLQHVFDKACVWVVYALEQGAEQVQTLALQDRFEVRLQTRLPSVFLWL